MSENPVLVPFVVEAEGTGVGQHLTVPGGAPHVFTTDTHPAFGGRDAAPSPLSYALGALSSCNQVTGSIVASQHGLAVGRWQVRVQGELDPSVLVGGAEGDANFRRVGISVSVETDADEELFARFTAEVERRCPVTQLFRRSGLEFTSAWTRVPLPSAV